MRRLFDFAFEAEESIPLGMVDVPSSSADAAELRALLGALAMGHQGSVEQLEGPSVIPDGFDLDLAARKDADGFLLFNGESPETRVDDVIVTGTRPRGGGGYDPGWYDWDGYDTSQSEPQDPPPIMIPYETVCGATGAIRDAINGLATNNTNEHVAVVIRGADGQLYASPPFAGSAITTSYGQLGQWMYERGIGLEDIVVLYHNHPSATSQAGDPDVYRYPSTVHTVRPGDPYDWAAADGFVANGTPGSSFSLAVEDQNGDVRYFAYADRALYNNLTSNQMASRPNLPPVTNGCSA